jgi:hypothetical protein
MEMVIVMHQLIDNIDLMHVENFFTLKRKEEGIMFG